MPNIEKAIRILEGNYKNSVLRHNRELITVNEILALLKAQKPHVMTLEEFQGSDRNPKWIESKDGSFARWTIGRAGYEKFYDETMTGYHHIDDYGKTWRCWTSEPSEEQRKETKWDD